MSSKRPQPTRAKASKGGGDPPAVARVRAVRAKMWADAGGTVKGLIELVERESEVLRSAKGMAGAQNTKTRTNNKTLGRKKIAA